MPSGHVVESLCFEVGFASEGQAFAWQSRLARFAQRRMVEVVGEVFDALSMPGEVWQLERVEVDLGVVAEGDGESVWVERLRAGLQRALGEQRRRLGSTASVAGAVMRLGQGSEAPEVAHSVSQSRDVAELRGLLFYLEQGHLPWSMGAADALALDAMALRVVAASGAELVAALRAADAGERMTRRLAWQFDARVCRAVMAATGRPMAVRWGSRDAVSAAAWRQLGLQMALGRGRWSEEGAQATGACVEAGGLVQFARDAAVSEALFGASDIGVVPRQAPGPAVSASAGEFFDVAGASALGRAGIAASRGRRGRPWAGKRRRGASGLRGEAIAIVQLAYKALHVPSGAADAGPSDRVGQEDDLHAAGPREEVSAMLRLALSLSLLEDEGDVARALALRMSEDGDERRWIASIDLGDAQAWSASNRSGEDSALPLMLRLSKDDVERSRHPSGIGNEAPAIDQSKGIDRADAAASPPFVLTASPFVLSLSKDGGSRVASIDIAGSGLDDVGLDSAPPLILSLSKDGGSRVASINIAGSPTSVPSEGLDDVAVDAALPLILSLSKDDVEPSRHRSGNGIEVPAIDPSKRIDRADGPAAPPFILSLSKDGGSRVASTDIAGSPTSIPSEGLDDVGVDAALPLILSLSKDDVERRRHGSSVGIEVSTIDRSKRLDGVVAPAESPFILSPSKEGASRRQDASGDGRRPVVTNPPGRRERVTALLRLALAMSLRGSRESVDAVLRQAQDERAGWGSNGRYASFAQNVSMAHEDNGAVLRQAQDERGQMSPNRGDEPSMPSLPTARDEGSVALRQAQDERAGWGSNSRYASFAQGMPMAREDAGTVLRQAQDERVGWGPNGFDASLAQSMPSAREDAVRVLRQAQDERVGRGSHGGDVSSARSLSMAREDAGTVLRQAQDERARWGSNARDASSAQGLSKVRDGSNEVLRPTQDERSWISPRPPASHALSTPAASIHHDDADALLSFARNLILQQARQDHGNSRPPGHLVDHDHPPDPAAPVPPPPPTRRWRHPPATPRASLKRRSSLPAVTSAEHRAMALHIALLADACAAAHGPAQRPRISALGALLLQRLQPPFDLHHATALLLQHMLMSMLPPRPAHWCRQVHQQLTEHSAPPHREAARSLADALAAVERDFAAQAIHSPGLTPEAGLGASLDDTRTPLYIANAGLVLAAPYLPRLWSMLDLAGERAFVHPAAAHRAVHLTQFLVAGDADPPAPEHRLVLNKLLCGVPIAEPVAATIDITSAEREAMLGLLQSMIQHWKILGRTSIAGLRESFLQREGRLLCSDDSWALQVEARAFDMLLDQIPWGYATLRFPWMPRLIHVDWR